MTYFQQPGAVHILYNAQEGGRGVENLLYYIREGVVFANVI